MSTRKDLRKFAAILTLSAMSTSLFASSHMDAPLITLDDAANTTDVYAFVSEADGVQYLSTAVGVYPFEEPGIGPNKHNFDDNVLYEIHVALGDDVAAGRKTLSYQFTFDTQFQDSATILQSYLGEVMNVGDASQNLIQTYSVTQVDHRTNSKTNLGAGNTLMVPPNNQGRLTRFYNQGDDGDMTAREGVSDELDLDIYTQQTIFDIADGHRVFAGQRDDGFYADIQSIFDLDFAFGGPNKPFDSQGGFNLHMIALNIPVSAIGGTDQVVGVYATTSRKRIKITRPKGDLIYGNWIQIARQGNPLFNEAIVAIEDKDRYGRTEPTEDAALFAKYAQAPELAAALGVTPLPDLSGIYIPDVIKVDMSTGPVPLAGNPDDPGFHRLSVFGGDTIASTLAGSDVPSGFPNGRRFGDDVVDIAVLAIVSSGAAPGANIDGVVANDITYNSVFPYAATPLNGRAHGHH